MLARLHRTRITEGFPCMEAFSACRWWSIMRPTFEDCHLRKHSAHEHLGHQMNISTIEQAPSEYTSHCRFWNRAFMHDQLDHLSELQASQSSRCLLMTCNRSQCSVAAISIPSGMDLESGHFGSKTFARDVVLCGGSQYTVRERIESARATSGHCNQRRRSVFGICSMHALGCNEHQGWPDMLSLKVLMERQLKILLSSRS
ncbi:hypothetical protein LY76DRAFT_74310 [Colletotrichum caudatum]|nr:hypothetical protein LY76DRAFT_74310 [Colletotrichum caudatum]